MYYRLTFISSTDKGKTGDSILNSLKPIDIGQVSTCAVRLPVSEEYEPTVFATIQPLGKEQWGIVRRSDNYDIKVNGKTLHTAQQLNNKDDIAFYDGTNTTVLRFETFTDGEYDASRGLVYTKHKASLKVFVACLLLTLAALGIAGFAVLRGSKDLRHSIPASYAKALYHITVDSVSLVETNDNNGKTTYRVLESVELQQAAVGTCFITESGLLVTARHCLEPWLDDTSWDGISLSSKMAPEVRLAVMAETAAQEGEGRYLVRSHCVISMGGYAKGFYSTDFKMDRSRDMVLQLGTEEQPLYWRTIFPIAHRRDMELGDFAYMKVPAELKAEFALPTASMQELEEFGKPEGDHDIAVMGYPVNDNDADDNAKTDFGNAQPLELDSLHHFLGCMQMTAPINRGNSGGPVLAFIKGKVKVVGIVSKADHRADQQTFWAVPITEVLDMHARGDKEKEDNTKFRR